MLSSVYILTFLTVITMTQTQNLTFLLSTMRTCGYVGEQLKSRTFSSDSENESNDRGG